MKNVFLNGIAILSANSKFVGYFEELDDPFIEDNNVLVVRLADGSTVEMEG